MSELYFATDRSRASYEKYRRDFAKLIWTIASPKWEFRDKTFDRTALAFDNADGVGHNWPGEAPEAFAKVVVEVAAL
jgi:hypothetical protein